MEHRSRGNDAVWIGMVDNNSGAICSAQRLAGATVDDLRNAVRLGVGNASRLLSRVKPINVEHDFARPRNERRSGRDKHLYVAGERDGCSDNKEAANEKECAHKRPNEKKLSHRWRDRALPRSLILKSFESYSSGPPAVGCSDWLDLRLS
jgi:hypothetical protein